MNLIETRKIKRKVKRTFLKKGTCSRTFFYILNQEFDNPKENEERAADPFAGGILQQGYQCGMLWGASMAAGAESFRKNKNLDQAIGITILATQHILESFKNRTESADCIDISSCDFSSKLSMTKYFFSGKFLSCYVLAEKWAPEAIQSTIEGLAKDHGCLPEQPVSCSSEVARKMGATDEEIVMVAGFAGGLGLSGNGCGALGAALWMNALNEIKSQTRRSGISDPSSEKILMRFYEETDYEMLCSKISGKCFKSIEEHTDFIKCGGCEKLINVLGQ